MSNSFFLTVWDETRRPGRRQWGKTYSYRQCPSVFGTQSSRPNWGRPVIAVTYDTSAHGDLDYFYTANFYRWRVRYELRYQGQFLEYARVGLALRLSTGVVGDDCRRGMHAIPVQTKKLALVELQILCLYSAVMRLAEQAVYAGVARGQRETEYFGRATVGGKLSIEV